MSDGGSGSLAKLVPGFEFLQGLAKTAGSAIPGVGGFGQWIAPTLDPDEIEKRISELRTVQFWLEQNARLLATTIQALEVQKMTLSTLKTMNLQLGEARSMFMPKSAAPAAAAAAKAAAPAPAAAPAAAAAAAAAEPAEKAKRSPARSAPASAGKAGVVDPMQWWAALTGQFTELAKQTLKDGAADAAKAMALPRQMASAAGAAAAGANKRPVATPKKRAGKRAGS